MVVEFIVYVDITKTLKKKTVVKKDVEIIKSFDSGKLTYQSYIGDQGKVVKKYSVLCYENEQWKVPYTIEEVKRKIGDYQILGYAAKASYGKKYNKDKRI